MAVFLPYYDVFEKFIVSLGLTSRLALR